MKVVATEKEEQNEAAVDPWTAVHFSSGLALGLMDVPFRWSVALSVSYEIIEQFVERTGWGQAVFETHRPESAPNALTDTAVFALGHWLGARWNRS